MPAGSYEYKVAVNDAWDESYGLNGGGDNIPLTVAGPSTLRFVFDDTTHRVGVEVKSLRAGYTADDDALVAAPVRQPGSQEQFYFVMTDRFANGDASNDEGGLTGDRLATGFDPTDKGFYNGGDIAGLRQKLDYIDGLGTTAIWLTPSFKNKPVQGDGANASAGYHGYWITDFTQIDPHLGTNAELEAFIEEAHAKDIKVYFDIITNHTADVIDYAEGQYSYIDKATSPYTDAAGTAFDPATYAGTDSFPALDPATSFPYTPKIAAGDEDAKMPAWLNDPTLYHNRGNSTWTGESVTYGDFDGLDDLMTEHPTVVNGFVDVYQDWIDLGIDGFRIDTAKHVNFEFWEQWTTEVLDYAREEKGKTDFFMFGEVYDADPVKLSPYVRDTDMIERARLHLPVVGRELRVGQQREGAAEPLRRRRLVHDARLVGDGPADVPRQPRHGSRRLHAAVDAERLRARSARARPDVPRPRPARRLLRRRAGLRGHRRRQGRPPDAVRDAGRRVPEPEPHHGCDRRLGRPLRHLRADLRARSPTSPHCAKRTRRSSPAPRSSATPTAAPASTPSRASTATRRSSTWSPSTTPPPTRR